MARSFTEITDLTKEEVLEVFELCRKMKSGEIAPKPLAGKSAACIFTKPSLRTRISFEVGINELGGNALYVTDKEISIGKRESVHDVAKVLSRYVGLIMIRTFAHSDVTGLAKYADVPVVNGLTDLVHPCQIMGDYFTLLEHRQKDVGHGRGDDQPQEPVDAGLEAVDVGAQAFQLLDDGQLAGGCGFDGKRRSRPTRPAQPGECLAEPLVAASHSRFVAGHSSMPHSVESSSRAWAMAPLIPSAASPVRARLSRSSRAMVRVAWSESA